MDGLLLFVLYGFYEEYKCYLLELLVNILERFIVKQRQDQDILFLIIWFLRIRWEDNDDEEVEEILL